MLQARATPLSPSQWQEMLRNAVAPKTTGAVSGGPSGGTSGGPGAGDNTHEVVVLDVRNAYEWDAGHFVGAQRPLEVSIAPSNSNFNFLTSNLTVFKGIEMRIFRAASQPRRLRVKGSSVGFMHLYGRYE